MTRLWKSAEHGRFTKAVLRNLEREEHVEHNGRVPWDGFVKDSVEGFEHDAKAWLGDRTDLKGSSIEKADYAVILDYVRDMNDLPPLDGPQTRFEEATKEAAREYEKAEGSARKKSQPFPREIRLTESLVGWLSGCGGWSGEEGPVVQGELQGLSWRPGKGAHGAVSFETLGYLLEQIGTIQGLSEFQHEAKAGAHFISEHEETYKAECKLRAREAQFAPGKPVYHTRTKKLVGWLTSDRFIPAEGS